MALFNKNPNESAFVGGKKHWVDVIKNSGSGELLIWRQPEEDFNTNSTLIVMPSEEAIFIKGGIIEQTFDNGTYKLSTENYPFISRLRNAFSGGISTFNCVVYFIRKAHSMEILWGTDSPIQVVDPIYDLETEIFARGSYKIQVDDGGKFLTKLLGNNIPFALQENLNDYFYNEFIKYIKSGIAKVIKASNTEIYGLISEADILSDAISPLLQEPLDNYGLKLITFNVAALDISDKNRDAFQKQRDQRREMNMFGVSKQYSDAVNLLGRVADNPGAGGAASMGAGIGMGLGAGSTFAGIAQQAFAPMQQPIQQPYSAIQSPSGRFTQKSATNDSATTKNSSDDPVATLKKLKEMLNLGLIEQSEYDTKKADIMSRM